MLVSVRYFLTHSSFNMKLDFLKEHQKQMCLNLVQIDSFCFDGFANLLVLRIHLGLHTNAWSEHLQIMNYSIKVLLVSPFSNKNNCCWKQIGFHRIHICFNKLKFFYIKYMYTVHVQHMTYSIRLYRNLWG